ncbi:HEAT repeat domain-containing protein [Sphingomonas psychrotolerans]|uniref:HEAT repeat domain-containing protein n=1 Tax=Sphingomonas psychrotolerans TaxID=1327635 RepID=A0ABU3N954_9SPHN|nr:HEAT repeat domain-containing protein [Sphingomonas psychrotolerans]MDT8760898.1 HEAT repeat domain-containing protein [Sphingomonas psychrotolerans]
MTTHDDQSAKGSYHELLYDVLGRDFVNEALSGDPPEVHRYLIVFSTVDKLLRNLSLGMEPDYSLIEAFDFPSFRDELVAVVQAMDKSAMADIVSSAIKIMGIFQDNRFIDLLKAHLSSPNDWERSAAIESVGGYSGHWVRSALVELSTNDPDEHVRFLAKARLSLDS